MTRAIDMQPIRSRALSDVGYNRTTRTLRVRFHHGGRYDYLDVPEHVYEALRCSQHPWTDWGRHIRDSYECIALE